MRYVLALSVLLLIALSIAKPSSASVIYESGSLGATGITWQQVTKQEVFGSNVSWFNFVGTRFEVASAVLTTQIGGHFVGGYDETSFFGALVTLSGADDFPDSEDLSTSDVLGVSILNLPHASAEAFGTLSVRLDPGWYAIVFGMHLFGTNGRGASVRNGLDFGTPSYVVWQDDPGWFNRSQLSEILQPGKQRFVVEGIAVPEPSAFLLLCLCAASPVGYCWRRTKYA